MSHGIEGRLITKSWHPSQEVTVCNKTHEGQLNVHLFRSFYELFKTYYILQLTQLSISDCYICGQYKSM